MRLFEQNLGFFGRNNLDTRPKFILKKLMAKLHIANLLMARGQIQLDKIGSNGRSHNAEEKLG